jgi:hypothetical protein
VTYSSDKAQPIDRSQQVAIRLEGGIGDHLLGMRLLRFVRNRYPNHDIIAYSDCGGQSEQIEVVKLSPHVSRVLPVFKDPLRVMDDNWWALSTLDSNDLALMRSADVFLDGDIKTLFIHQSKALDVPFYEILASRPDLRIPEAAVAAVNAILPGDRGDRYVALNLSKHGANMIQSIFAFIQPLLRSLLNDPKVKVVNVYKRTFEFAHWPEGRRRVRQDVITKEALVNESIDTSHDRMVPIVDRPIVEVAAILARCQYFIGVDNGIKHLAWALGIPHTMVLPGVSDMSMITRWIPDFNRTLLLNDSDDMSRHMQFAAEQIKKSMPVG